jgi:type I restriction enzyme, S subunit
MLKLGKISSPLYHFKLKDIIERIANPIDVVPGQKYTQIGIRSHGKGIFIKEEVTGAELGNKRVFWIEPDCFIVNIVFAWERAVSRTTSELEGLIASHRFPMYKVDNLKVDLDYFTRLFLTKKGQMFLELASPGGAGRNKTLGQKEFLNLEIDLPTLEIQKYISSFLKLIENKIQLQQEKIDLLNEQKKGYMQKIFNQEFRFKDDSGKDFPQWTITFLKDIVSKKFKGSNADYTEGSSHGNLLLHNEFLELGINPLYVNNTNDVSNKNILILWDGSQAGNVYFNREGVLGSTFIALEFIPKINSNFIGQQLQYFEPIIKKSWREGSGVPHVSKSFIDKFKVKICFEEEQQKISDFLNMYDKKIKIEQSKLLELDKLKQAFLQQFFI